jgi:hypothetical protein
VLSLKGWDTENFSARFRKYPSHKIGEYDMKKLEKTATLRTAHCTQAAESAFVKLQDV